MGMIRVIFWAIVGLLALSFFGISIQSIIDSPAGQANFTYVFGLLTDLWNWLLANLHTTVEQLRVFLPFLPGLK